jgi:hypothetical protein
MKSMRRFFQGLKQWYTENCKAILGILFYWGFIVVSHFFLKHDWQKTGQVAIVLTGIVLIWYTWETFQ